MLNIKKKSLRRYAICLLLFITFIIISSCAIKSEKKVVINETGYESSDISSSEKDANELNEVETETEVKKIDEEMQKFTEKDLIVLDESKIKNFTDAHIFKDKLEYPYMDGSTALMPLMAEFRKDVLGLTIEDAENETTCSKTAKAWYNLSAGLRDILIVGEMPNTVKNDLISAMNTDMKNAKKIHKMQYAPIRREGLVFIVNKNNPVESLTKEQLIDIYTGKITNWKEVGGNDVEIAAFQRNEDSGSQTIFRKVLMKDIAPIKKEEYYYTGEMDSLINVLSTYDNSANAIGYSVFYYVTEMYKNDNLKLIKVDGIEPSKESISNNSYPLLNESYVAIRYDEPNDSNARKLYNFIRSDKGKETIISAGYVPVE